MKYLKILGLAAVAAMALTAIIGAGTASATELYKWTEGDVSDTLASGTVIESTLQSGSSALLVDTSKSTNDTCTSSTVKGKTTNSGGSGVAVVGNIETLSFGGCTHTTTPIKNADGTFGKLEIKWISGTTNGTVISRESRVTVNSTVFGISCTANTGEGTPIGTLTGIPTGANAHKEHAIMHINGVINMGAFCGDSTWTGTYVVTSPTGLFVEDK